MRRGITQVFLSNVLSYSEENGLFIDKTRYGTLLFKLLQSEAIMRELLEIATGGFADLNLLGVAIIPIYSN